MAQTTSELWSTLWNTKNTGIEYAFDINGTLYDPATDAEVSHSVGHSLFDEFGIGNATTAKLTLKIYADDIPRGATIKRYVRLVNGDTVSEWLPKGEFFVSRRVADEDLWSIDAYDALRKAEVVWEPDQTLIFPITMPDAVAEFCRILGVELDERTELNSSYTIDYPANDYTIRKELGFIAAAHGGNWIMTDEGRLRLVPLLPSGSVHEVGLDLVLLNDNGLRPPVSRVTLWVDDENCYTSGDDTGREIVGDCPHATQSIVNALAASLVGYEYQAYTAGAVTIDPAAELGDPVKAGDMVSFVASISDKGSGYPDISAPGEQEMDDEYPDAGPMQQEFNRKIAQTRAEIKKTANSITLSVTNDKSGTSSYFELKSGETVLSSGNITFDGFVTFLGLATGTTTIDGGCIKTGTILADLIKAGVLKSKDGETFVLDLDTGAFSMKGSGRFQSPDGNTYIEIVGNELVMYALDEKTGEYLDKIHFGFITGSNPVDKNSTIDYPYMLLGKASGDVGMVKKFFNGLWIGNSVPQNASGIFEGMEGASGFFINTLTGVSYVVNGTDMKDVYAGAAGEMTLTSEVIEHDGDKLSDRMPVCLTQAEYDALVASGKVNEDTPYLIKKEE